MRTMGPHPHEGEPRTQRGLTRLQGAQILCSVANDGYKVGGAEKQHLQHVCESEIPQKERMSSTRGCP